MIYVLLIVGFEDRINVHPSNSRSQSSLIDWWRRRDNHNFYEHHSCCCPYYCRNKDGANFIVYCRRFAYAYWIKIYEYAVKCKIAWMILASPDLRHRFELGGGDKSKLILMNVNNVLRKDRLIVVTMGLLPDLICFSLYRKHIGNLHWMIIDLQLQVLVGELNTFSFTFEGHIWLSRYILRWQHLR